MLPSRPLPLQFDGLLRAVPSLQEAWDDPLYQHYRDLVLSQEPRRRGLLFSVVIPVAWLLHGLLLYALPVRLPVVPELLGSVGLPVLAVVLFLWARPIRGRRRLDWLTRFDHEMWNLVPLSPRRASRLVALKVILDRALPSPILRGTVVTAVLVAVHSVLHLLLLSRWGAPLQAIAFLFAVVINVGLVQGVLSPQLQAPPIEGLVMLYRLHLLAEKLPLYPLSKDPTATSRQKAMLYGDYAYDVAMGWGMGVQSGTGDSLEFSRAMNMVPRNLLTINYQDLEDGLDVFASLLERWMIDYRPHRDPPMPKEKREAWEEKRGRGSAS